MISTTGYSNKYRRQHVAQKVGAIKKAIGKAEGGNPLSQMSVNIITAGDKKVCNICRQARKDGHPLPPDHPNCRCRITRG